MKEFWEKHILYQYSITNDEKHLAGSMGNINMHANRGENIWEGIRLLNIMNQYLFEWWECSQ